MPFGQLVMGPPGSGKSTYCAGMAEYMRGMGRKVALVNLDPANDAPPYTPDTDISELVDLQNVMQELGLGPNGGLLYCMDFLEQNMDWLREALTLHEQGGAYFLFDLPGQVELFTLQPSFKHVIHTLTNDWGYRLAAVTLADSLLCTDPAKYIGCLLLCLNTMLVLELPHVNVLSKADLFDQYDQAAFKLDFYTEVQDLGYLVRHLDERPFMRKHRKLSAGICEVVEEFGLVRFAPLAIQDKRMVGRVLGLADQANGYVFASLASETPHPPEFVYGAAAQLDEADIWSAADGTRALAVQAITERAEGSQQPPAHQLP